MVQAVRQRDAERTRGLILEAAAAVLREQGPGASLDTVATKAGVSKGGLLHHFPSRDALFAALSDEWLRRFDAAIAAHLDSDDTEPGRLCRAQIRASFDQLSTPEPQPWRDPVVLAALFAIPECRERMREADARWRRELAEDGMHEERVLLISRALDGLLMSELAAGGDAAERATTRELLLTLSRGDGPIT